jgi:hypothetical protein
MQKKLNGKLTLSRETLRNLSPKDLDEVKGGATTSRTNTSNPTDTCESCVGCTTSRNTIC